MKCPKCKGDVKVEYTLSDTEGVYRKRRCIKCGHVFYTSEVEDSADMFKSLLRQQNKRRLVDERKQWEYNKA